MQKHMQRNSYEIKNMYLKMYIYWVACEWVQAQKSITKLNSAIGNLQWVFGDW